MRTTTRRKRIVGALVAAAATAAVSLASPAASYAAGTPSASSGADAGKLSQGQWKKLDEITKKLGPLGVSGGESGPRSSKPVVALPAGTPATEVSRLTAEIPAGADVTVKTSQFTKNELEKLKKKVLQKKWTADGDRYFVGVSYDAGQDKVQVSTDAPESAAQSLLDANPGQITVERSRVEQQANRFDDWPAFSGGAAIKSTINDPQYRGWCSMGIAVQSVFTGQRYGTTAAHCGQLGEHFQNRHTDGGPGAYLGYVSARSVNLDQMLIAGTNYKGWLWTGGYNTSHTNNFVQGYSGVWHGLKVCVSGATSFNHCGHKVVNTGFSYNWNTGTWIDGNNGFLYDQGGSWQPWGWQWGQTTQGGDSGAPIYYTPDPSGAGAFIVGLHSALKWDDPCGCYTMIGTKLGPFLQAHSLDVVHASDG
ncbi:hypothetical protein ACFZC6_45070 [Streptomyces ossamyceticus]|uniref:Streptogrisin C n=1 Tax=Streptomyces ossamyceticus TaxID=249581 RepID=A0ABV2VAA8_9ACTN